MNVTSYVLYKRVSTTRQGISGLGLDAQTEACDRFIKVNGGVVVQEFVEIETGKSSSRPELTKAVKLCKQGGYTLLCSKMDRLARNLHLITTLQQSGIQFRAVDNPHATPLLIHILCAISEAEAVAISTRTREALKQAKLRGTRLGAPVESLEKSRELAKRAVQAHKVAFAESAIRAINELREIGITSYTKLAECLTKRGERTSRNKTEWTATGVRRVLEAVESRAICKN